MLARLRRAGNKIAGMSSTFPVRKIAVAIFGTGVLVCGVALIVLPGPAVLVIPLGLAILAKEFPWARRLLDQVTKFFRGLKVRALRTLGKVTSRLTTICGYCWHKLTPSTALNGVGK